MAIQKNLDSFTRRDFLTKAMLPAGTFVLAPGLFLTSNANANAKLTELLYVFVGNVLQPLASKIGNFIIGDDGKVALENVKIQVAPEKKPKQFEIKELGNFYLGEDIKIGNVYVKPAVDPYSIANLGGVSGRQITRVSHINRQAIVNPDIFDMWREQNVKVTEHMGNQSQIRLRPDIYPAAYKSMNSLPFEMTKRLVRCDVCRIVSGREPYGISSIHSKSNRVYGFSEIEGAKGSILKHIWMNPVSGYREIVSTEKITENRYRTYSYKDNNPYPGSWAYAVAIDDVIEEIVGFQWVDNLIFV